MKEIQPSSMSDREGQSINSPTKEIKTASRRSSSTSSISSGSIGRIANEAYNDPGEKIEALSPKSSRIREADLSRHVTGVSVAGSMAPGFEVDFSDEDPGDPKNWPLWKRGLILFFISYSTLTV
jgi:hypothetical protein